MTTRKIGGKVTDPELQPEFLVTVNLTLQAESEDDAVDQIYDVLNQAGIFGMWSFSEVKETE